MTGTYSPMSDACTKYLSSDAFFGHDFCCGSQESVQVLQVCDGVNAAAAHRVVVARDGSDHDDAGIAGVRHHGHDTRGEPQLLSSTLCSIKEAFEPERHLTTTGL